MKKIIVRKPGPVRLTGFAATLHCSRSQATEGDPPVAMLAGLGRGVRPRLGGCDVAPNAPDPV